MRLIGALLWLFLALGFAATSALAQDQRSVAITYNLLCAEASSPDGFVSPKLTYLGYDNPVLFSGQSYSMFLGSADLKFTISNAYPERDEKTVIREIAVVDAAGNRTVIASPNSREASLIYSIPGPANAASDDFGFDLKIDECAGKTRLKIATTSSCRGLDGEDFIVQPDVAVMIGGQEFKSNVNGVIEADVPLGKYEVTARWYDAGLSYVKRDGMAVPKTETGKPIVTLTKDAETLELRMATCDSAGATKVRARLTELGGTGRFQAGKKAGRPLMAGLPFVDGDVVVINGTAVVTWEDGHVARFNDPKGTAIIRIGADAQAPTGNEPSEAGKIELLKGILHFFVPTDPDQPTHKFGASTHSVAIGIKGTEFFLTHDDATETTTVSLLEGAVTLTPTNSALAPFDLKPGESVTVTPTSVSAIGTAIAGGTAGGWGSKVTGTPLGAYPRPTAGEYLGCYADTSVFDLDGYLERSPDNTIAGCVAICAERGFAYAGVQYGESCLCGNSYGRYGQSNACNFQCTGDAGEVCGGYNANSVYGTGN